jgi:hypothetical protein
MEPKELANVPADAIAAMLPAAGVKVACAATNRMDCASIRMDDAGVGRRLGVARP